MSAASFYMYYSFLLCTSIGIPEIYSVICLIFLCYFFIYSIHCLKLFQISVIFN